MDRRDINPDPRGAARFIKEVRQYDWVHKLDPNVVDGYHLLMRYSQRHAQKNLTKKSKLR